MAKTKVTLGGIAAGAVSNTDLVEDAVTFNSTTVALGGSGTIDTFTDNLPTITSLTPSVVENTSTAVVIAGTNFVSIPVVEAISTTGAIVVADSVTFTSAISLTATFTLPIDGTYYVRVENSNGLAVRTSTADLTVSDATFMDYISGHIRNFCRSSSNRQQ